VAMIFQKKKKESQIFPFDKKKKHPNFLLNHHFSTHCSSKQPGNKRIIYFHSWSIAKNG
jgi:hypothetical protein